MTAAASSTSTQTPRPTAPRGPIAQGPANRCRSSFSASASRGGVSCRWRHRHLHHHRDRARSGGARPRVPGAAVRRRCTAARLQRARVGRRVSLLAFAAAAHALRRDRTEGIRGLFVARRPRCAATCWVASAGSPCSSRCSLQVERCSVGLPRGGGAVGRHGAARSAPTGAGIVFAIAFSAVVAPVAFAVLGARSRIGGYLFSSAS